MPYYPKITNRSLIYDSPSGKININKYVPPFERIVNGFGFMGVVIEDSESGFLQCNICGKWYENIPTHLRHHKILARDYKIKFGLNQSTALKSKRIRINQSRVMEGMRRTHKKHRMKFVKNNIYAGNTLGKKKSLETINKYGICDLQIKDKVLKLKEKLGKTPTLNDLAKVYGNTFISHITKRYRSYVILCKDLDMQPHFSNANPKYSREYFIEKALSNEASTRIFDISERRNLYKYIKGGILELKEIVEKIKNE